MNAEENQPESVAGDFLHGEVKAIVDKIIARNASPFKANLDRIIALVRLAEDAFKGEEAKEKAKDLLRAAVVFLHASVEELLRGVALLYLPVSGEESLDKIPLAGSFDPLRAEKFFLGRLFQHRGKTVDELIAQSVAENTARRTFSSTTEIIGFLKTVGFGTDADLEKLLPALDELMKRRHQIVHRADLLSGQTTPTDIDTDTVLKWAETVTNFLQVICSMEAMKIVPLHLRQQ